MSKVLAVIPARGGSKRIPYKNIKDFCGLPMLVWSIKAAQQSHCFDRIVVSTDDEKIAEVARAAGADVPFMRDAGLSDDHTGTSVVVKDAIEQLAAQGGHYETTCCLYATAPLMQSSDLVSARHQLDNTVDYVFSATSFDFPVQRALVKNKDNSVHPMFIDMIGKRSQDLEEAIHDAGQFYWGTSEAWLTAKPVFSANSRAYMLPRYRVQDIDTPEDWQRAELIMKALKMNEGS
jgi:N-acylneuraminate cytidylyltransferase